MDLLYLVLYSTTADHAQTAIHGRMGSQGKLFRQQPKHHIKNGRFDKAMKMDIDDINSKMKSGVIKGNYSQSMIEAVERARSKGNLTEAQSKRLKKS
ncbi:hypothetical protein ACFSX9_10750 [Flavobacterium ardleyense]|uniref:Uncharacterized protein n=1 Tax=Flavobacterium ardleyense TaxID=2038737 RepID=A0ABW5Z991_9FLAO